MPFDLDVMRTVVRQYASLLCQDPLCKDCEFLPEPEFDEELPEGFEPLRDYPGWTRQCEFHRQPLHPWLLENPERAAEWLVSQSSNGPFRPNFEAWHKAVTNGI